MSSGDSSVETELNGIATDTQQSHTTNTIASAMDIQTLLNSFAEQTRIQRELDEKRNEAILAKMDLQLQEANLRHKTEKDELIAKLSELTTAAATSDSDSGVTLSNNGKFQRVLNEFRKSTRVKEFSPLQMNVEEWLQAVFDEVGIICATKGMKLTDLKDAQKVLLVRSRLPHKMVTQLEVFLKRENSNFDDVTYVRFKELFEKHGGKSVPPVTAVMEIFGPDRIKKAKGTEMLHHVLDFKNKLPSCMHPKETDQDLKSFVDLMHRTAFFASIEEAEIRTALLKIPESKADYEEFTKVAIETAELLKGDKSSAEALKKVDGVQQSSTTVLKVDSNSSSKGKGRKPWRGRGRGRGSKTGNRGGANVGNNQSGTKNDSSKSSEVECWSCGTFGHMANKCPNRGQGASATPSGSVPAKLIDLVQQHLPSPEVFSCAVSCNDTKREGYIDMSLILNGHLQAMFEFDTAAGACILPKAWLDLFSPEHKPALQYFVTFG